MGIWIQNVRPKEKRTIDHLSVTFLNIEKISAREGAEVCHLLAAGSSGHLLIAVNDCNKGCSSRSEQEVRDKGIVLWQMLMQNCCERVTERE